MLVEFGIPLELVNKVVVKKVDQEDIGNGLTLLKHMERKNNESAINEME